jgi:hypothetical protein
MGCALCRTIRVSDTEVFPTHRRESEEPSLVPFQPPNTIASSERSMSFRGVKKTPIAAEPTVQTLFKLT